MDQRLNIPESDHMFSRGNAEEEIAHRAFEAQLSHTRNMINQLETHPHFTDDCGEYLAHALEVTSRLMNARQDGAGALYAEMMDMLQPAADDDQEQEGAQVSDLLMFSTDSLASELVDWAKANGAKDFDDAD